MDSTFALLALRDLCIFPVRGQDRMRRLLPLLDFGGFLVRTFSLSSIQGGNFTDFCSEMQLYKIAAVNDSTNPDSQDSEVPVGRF